MPSLLPPCPIHQWTGLLCPGCGGTHCLLALVRGDVPAAWHHNALLTVLLPLAILVAAAHLISIARHRPTPAARLLHSPAALWTLAVATTLFSIARNLP